MSFGDIKDQDVPLRLLRNMLQRKRIPNALMFWGPGGVGKRLTALEFAKAINCTEAEADACDTCLSCRKIKSGNHPDISVVVPVKRSRNIDVETIQGITEQASLRPYESSWRVFLILDADRMREPAQNHFLKTLEEPPGKTVFILVTEFPRSLLPTIRSRCQTVRFRTLRPETVSGLLQRERQLGGAEADAIAALAQGQMSRAFDLVDSEKRDVVLSVTQRLFDGEDPSELAEEFTRELAAQRKAIEGAVSDEYSGGDAEISREDKERVKEERMALLDALFQRDIMEHLYLFETWYRDELVYRATGDSSRVMNRDQLARLENARPGDTANKLAAIERARVYLERFINEERVFRDLFFTLSE